MFKKKGILLFVLTLMLAVLLPAMAYATDDLPSETGTQIIVGEDNLHYCEDELYTGWFTTDDGTIVYCENGVLSTQTGTVEIDGATYYLLNGARQTGFITIDGKVYYFDSQTGKQYTGTGKKKINDYYYYFKSGVRKTGFITIDSKVYYFDSQTGKQYTGTGKKKINDYYYYFKSGVRKTGFITIDSKVYYFDSKTGKQYTGTGRKKISDYYYYFKSGVRKTGFITVNEKVYYFQSSGKQLTSTGKKKINGSYYYFDKGVRYSGWKKIDGGRYYFGSNGKMFTGLKKIDSKYFYFNSTGKALTGKRTVDGSTYYFKKTGKLGKYGSSVSGWVTIKEDKACYYFSKKTFKIVKDKIVDSYILDENGASKTRYEILKIVDKYTTDDMTKDEKIKALWNYVVGNSWTYTRTYEHTASTWKWYDGWTDDFAYSIIKNKSGNCFRYASVLGYLIKEATGYQVRVYHGQTPALRGGLTPHGWITVNIDGTWYAYDPDLYKFSSKKSKYYKTPFSQTKKSFHLKGKYTALY